MARALPARIAAFAFVGALIGLRRGTRRFDEIGAQLIVVLPDQEEHTHAQHREHCSRAPRYEEIYSMSRWIIAIAGGVRKVFHRFEPTDVVPD
jgi:hypothetical protein